MKQENRRNEIRQEETETETRIYGILSGFQNHWHGDCDSPSERVTVLPWQRTKSEVI
jgi:hypothetical protein